MRYLLSVLTLLLSTAMFAQQPGQPPPQTTPPTFPEGQQAPTQQMPPDEKAPPPQNSSAKQVEHRVQQALDSEPTLKNSHVGVKADKNSVVLTGTVATEEQHDLALRIAQSHAGDRKIVDKIKLRQQG
jgi:osmotically-inducible protein OsmY